MRVVVNGDTREVDAKLLGDLLIELGYDGDQIAVAVNETFVHREQRPTTRLATDCRIEIVAPMEGG